MDRAPGITRCLSLMYLMKWLFTEQTKLILTFRNQSQQVTRICKCHRRRYTIKSNLTSKFSFRAQQLNYFIPPICNSNRSSFPTHIDIGNPIKFPSPLPTWTKLKGKLILRTFAPIATAHPYSARKFTCRVMHRARALSTKMNNDRADGHCYSFAWI